MHKFLKYDYASIVSSGNLSEDKRPRKELSNTNKCINELTSKLEESKKCRVCLQQGNIPVFKKGSLLDFPLSHYLKLICNIDMTDNDRCPQHLCKACFNTLDSAIKLRKTAMKSQLKLKLTTSRELLVKKCRDKEKFNCKSDILMLLQKKEMKQKSDVLTLSEKLKGRAQTAYNSDKLTLSKGLREKKQRKYQSGFDVSTPSNKHKDKDLVKYNCDVLVPSKKVKERNQNNLNEDLTLIRELKERDTLKNNEEPLSKGSSKRDEIKYNCTVPTISLYLEKKAQVTYNDLIFSKKLKEGYQIVYNNEAPTFSPLQETENKINIEDIDKIKTNLAPILETSENKEHSHIYEKPNQVKQARQPDNVIPILTSDQVNKLRTKDIPYSTYYKKVITTPMNKQTYQCRICEKNYKRDSIADHILSHLPNSVSLYVCEICGKTFKKFCTFYKHKYVHQSTLPYECKLCPYRGRSKSLLQVHIKRKHKKAYKFQCTNCPRTFLDTNTLRYHQRRHKEPKFQCTVCNKTFYEINLLKKHMESQHTTVIPQKCDVCGNVYKNRKSLLSHQIKIHKRKQVYNNRAAYLKFNQLKGRLI